MPTRRYLRRLEIDAGAPPTLDTLFLVHDRHLTRVPYENLGIMLGLPPSVDPETYLDRIGRVGRAGYCLHQNAALELVLERPRVRRTTPARARRGRTRRLERPAQPPGARA